MPWTIKDAQVVICEECGQQFHAGDAPWLPWNSAGCHHHGLGHRRFCFIGWQDGAMIERRKVYPSKRVAA